MLQFRVVNKSQDQTLRHVAGPLEFGRGPRVDDVPRCIIQDLSVSRNHLRVEEHRRGVLRVVNLSNKTPVRLNESSIVQPGASADMFLPGRLSLGETVVEVATDDLADAPLATLSRPVRAVDPANRLSLSTLGDTPDAERLTQWFETVLAVQRAAAGSPEFYTQTAEALIEIVGLDRGLVLLRHGPRWEVAARVMDREESSGRDFSTTLLAKVVEEGRTFYQGEVSLASAESLQGVEAVVASPIFDGRGEVAGVLYGSRTKVSRGRPPGIGKLQAQVVQLLASALGAGLSRQQQEADAARLRVQLEQAFTPDLASELIRNPSILEGREREVTVLFSDIRGFSRLTQQLPPADVCHLVSDVMECLTQHVRAHDGVVVDYYGDGMCAMWNAPFDQPDHAAHACRAAVAVLEDLPQVSARWHDRLGSPLGVGLGVNTGPALVGNTGSRQKIKYGPFGHTVNLASRIEGATKFLGVSALVTGSTHNLVQGRFATRRLCQVRVVGMKGAVEVHELTGATTTPEWTARRDAYEAALRSFEEGDWSAACRTVYPILGGLAGQYDVPSLNLIARAVECMRSPPATFDPAWDLTTK